VSLRRYTRLMPRRRYVAPVKRDPIPPAVRAYVKARDGGCVLQKIAPGSHQCWGAIEIDHVRASGGLGLKSRSTPDNLVCLCSAAHQAKTLHGRLIRPLLLEYLAKVEAA
jgi:5-methylcytosine-specific restriction endonuclease McrA